MNTETSITVRLPWKVRGSTYWVDYCIVDRGDGSPLAYYGERRNKNTTGYYWNRVTHAPLIKRIRAAAHDAGYRV